MAAQQKRRSGSLTSIFFGRQRRYSLGTMMQDLTGKRASWGETYSNLDHEEVNPVERLDDCTIFMVQTKPQRTARGMLGPIVDRKLVISKFGLKEVDIATGKEVDATTFGKIKNFYWDKKEMYFVIMTHNDRESNIPIVYRTSKGQGAELREEIDRFVKLAAVGDPARIPKFSADLKKFNKHLSADTEPGGEPISEDEEQQAEQEDEEQQAEQEEEEKTPSAPCAVPEGNLISFDF